MIGFTSQSVGNRQQGAALVISLILLLVMSLIGVASMNGAKLEITMAALMQQQEIALRRAERTLSFAEAHVESIVTTPGQFQFSTDNDAYYVVADNLDASVVDWSGLHATAGPEFTDNSIDDDDAILVEYYGTRAVSGESESETVDTPIAGSMAHVYRITSRSATGGKAVRMVQSMYTTMEAP
jgi:type IV pilus assembly protein PilX